MSGTEADTPKQEQAPAAAGEAAGLTPQEHFVALAQAMVEAQAEHDPEGAAEFRRQMSDPDVVDEKLGRMVEVLKDMHHQLRLKHRFPD